MSIIELQPREFSRVLPAYRAGGLYFPLITAVVENKQRGQVFTDGLGEPQSALVVTNFGFTFFIGNEDNQSFIDGVADLFRTRESLIPTYLLWYTPPIGWQRRLKTCESGLVRRRERMRFDFRPEDAAWLDQPLSLPVGFSLERLTTDLVPKTDKLGLKLGSRFWSSASDFYENGLGVCVVKDEEIVSVCYAAAIADGLAEIDVVTDQQFRGKGLGNIVARKFIIESLRSEITPTWDCFVENAPSMKLAQKLGFKSRKSYPFYSFNVPLKIGNLSATFDSGAQV